MMLTLALAVSAVGCPCVRSAVNSNETIRWWLFSNFAASKICPEMLKRGVPLKLAVLGPSSIGRFFPQQCAVRIDDNTRTMVMDATGTGYVVLPLTRRVGFYCGVSVEFRPDFRLEEDATYVWGRYNRVLAPPDLRILGVENPVVSLATRTPIGDVATLLGQGVVESELARGFTVVRLDDGDDFTLGILMPPDRPKRQFASGSDRTVLGSDAIELHAASRDYLGPFEVAQNGAALYVKLRVAGAPVDYFIVDRGLGDAWRQPYQAAFPIGPPPGQPIAYGQAQSGDVTRAFAVAPGSYYLVVENRAPAPAAILGMPMPFEQMTHVSYAVELGDR
jgi:hypothetical protein